MKQIIVAIDGFSSCGKSTMAKNLAKAVGYTYIDSGAMYRAVTLFTIRNNFFDGETVNESQLQSAIDQIQITFHINPENGQTETYLNGENVESEIRSMQVASSVSRVAAIGFVRRKLVDKQQALGKEKGLVMDGRDIGTVVFPDAELKIYVTASAEVRARRRYDEMIAKGQVASYEEILANVQQRDRIDLTREESPLRKAGDAIELDNTHMTIAEQQEWLLKQFKRVTT